MTNSLMRWHLARDNQLKLARFCQKHKIKSEVIDADYDTFNMRFDFSNGSFIEAELMRGDVNHGYSVADHFQVVDYAWGTA